MVRLAREHGALRVVADQLGTPTWRRFVADATAVALRQAVLGGALVAPTRRAVPPVLRHGCRIWAGRAPASQLSIVFQQIWRTCLRYC